MSLLQLALNISNAIDDLYDHDEPVSEFAQFEAIYNELVDHNDYDYSDFEPIDDDTDNFTTADSLDHAYGVMADGDPATPAYKFDPIPEPEGAYVGIQNGNNFQGWYSVFAPCPDGSQAAKGAK